MGESVFLKIRPHRQASLKGVIHTKISTRYYGLFWIIQRVGKVAYRLQLPMEAKIHPVFHVSQLKRVVQQHTMATELPHGWEEIRQTIEPNAVLQTKSELINGSTQTQLLVKWKGYPVEEATWMNHSDFINQFPTPALRTRLFL